MSIAYKIDHIGIAVSDLEAAVKVYEAVLGVKPSGVEEMPGRSVKVAFFPVGDANLELVSPIEGKGTIADFLSRRGPGLHHICLGVKGIEEVLSRFKKQGVRLIDEVPREGAHGKRVAFLHPSAVGGVLIELAEDLEPIGRF